MKNGTRPTGLTPYYEDEFVTLYCGDAREILPQLEVGVAQTCITSPPYFGLRDYGTADWQGGDPEHEHDRVAARNGRGGSGSGDKQTKDAFPSTLPAETCSC